MDILTLGGVRAILGAAILVMSCDFDKAAPERLPNDLVGRIRVIGVATGVVLAGPGGGFDADNGHTKTCGIPGCVRDVGRDGQEPGEDEDEGDFVDFTFRDAPPGKYVLWVAVSQPDTVLIGAEIYGAGAVVECGESFGEHAMRAGGRYRFEIDIKSRDVVSRCGIRGGPLTEAPWPRRFRRFLK